jgi:hypothetical protein
MTKKNRSNAEYRYYNSATGELDWSGSVLFRPLNVFPRDDIRVARW